jgi:hypothetical protein
MASSGIESVSLAPAQRAEVCLAWKNKCATETCSYGDAELKDCAIKVPATHDIHFLRIRLTDEPFLCIHDSDGSTAQLRGSDHLLRELNLCTMDQMERSINNNEAFVFQEIPDHPSNPGNMCGTNMIPVLGENTNMIKCVVLPGVIPEMGSGAAGGVSE